MAGDTEEREKLAAVLDDCWRGPVLRKERFGRRCAIGVGLTDLAAASSRAKLGPEPFATMPVSLSITISAIKGSGWSG